MLKAAPVAAAWVNPNPVLVVRVCAGAGLLFSVCVCVRDLLNFVHVESIRLQLLCLCAAVSSGDRYILGAFLLLADKVEHVRRLNNQGRDARARMDLQVYT